MRIIIHIGYPKTGTTWFQRNFFPRVKNYVYMEEVTIIRDLLKEDALDFDSQKIRNTFDRLYKGENVIISLEGLVGSTHGFGIKGFYTKEIAHRLKLVFPESEILIGIRNQLTMIPSTYLQYVRSGGTYGIKKYLYHNDFFGINSMTLFTFKYFEYDKVLRLYYDLFGENNVKVYLFEYLLEDMVIFLNNLVKHYNFDIDLSKIDLSVRLPRLRKRLIFIVYFLNLFTNKKMINKYYLINIPYFDTIRRKIINILNKWSIFGDYVNYKKVLGTRSYSYVMEYYKKSNHILYEKYHLDVEKYHYPY